jgi:ATP-binding cassette subfamily F protein 3
VEQSFYAQHQLEALHLGNSILEEMATAGSQKTDLELRTLLGCFLFGGDDVDKKIRVLSGGEKARVALAKTIISKANFLLLDEPTNHLDMHSVDLLIEALAKYEGSFILVSHDRYFISKTANKIWEIVDGKIKEFRGTYTEWVEWNERMAKKAASEQKAAREQQQAAAPKKADKPTPAKEPQPQPAKPQPIDKEKQKEQRKLQKRFEELEAKISSLQSERKSLEARLAEPDVYSDKQKFVDTEKKYASLSQELSQAEAEYEAVFEKLSAQEN